MRITKKQIEMGYPRKTLDKMGGGYGAVITKLFREVYVFRDLRNTFEIQGILRDKPNFKNARKEGMCIIYLGTQVSDLDNSAEIHTVLEIKKKEAMANAN